MLGINSSCVTKYVESSTIDLFTTLCASCYFELVFLTWGHIVSSWKKDISLNELSLF